MFERQSIKNGYRCTLDNGATLNVTAYQRDDMRMWIRVERDGNAFERILEGYETSEGAIHDTILRMRAEATRIKKRATSVTVVDFLIVPG